MNILQVLRISYTLYDNYRERNYQAYCMEMAKQLGISYRSLHVHDGLRNYYNDMWQLHVEELFFKENAIYFAVAEADILQDLFMTYPANIQDDKGVKMYPKALLKLIINDLKAYKHDRV